MRKEIKENKKEKVVKLNIDYINFIKDLYNEKIEIRKENKEKILNLYSEKLNLRFNNLERVNKRVMRKELNNIRNNYLKEISLKDKDFIKLSKDLVKLSKNRKNKYIVNI